jgi:hypothetical protein
MKPVAQLVTSVAGTIVASLLASWMLRRLIFALERTQPESREGQPARVVVMVPIDTIGSPIGNQWMTGLPDVLNALDRRAKRRRAGSQRWLRR